MLAGQVNRGLVIAFALAGLTGCMKTYPLESYPWAMPQEPCCASSMEGHGIVQTSDSSVIPPDFIYEVTLSDQGGTTTVIGKGSEFHFTMTQETITRSSLYAWTATARATKDGPVLYRTPRPQPFLPAYPIVVIVEPVAAANER